MLVNSIFTIRTPPNSLHSAPNLSCRARRAHIYNSLLPVRFVRAAAVLATRRTPRGHARTLRATPAAMRFIGFAVALGAVATIATALALYLIIYNRGNGDRKRRAKRDKQSYFPTAHFVSPPSFLTLRRGSFILPLLNNAIIVTAAATAASQINSVHHHAPTVYTAALTV